MTWKHFFSSSIGKKIIMGFTGLCLIGFLIVHCAINSMIFFNDNGETFNHWAHFMGTNLIVRTMEIGLFAGLLLHIVQGLILWGQNSKARPVKYAMNDANSNSKWYSRSMGLLGTLLLLFLIIHLYHFWTPSRFGGMMGVHSLEETSLTDYEGQSVHNLYREMQLVFSQLWVVIVYILGVIALAWHLLHGFQSAFQTFGINHKRWTPIIKGVGAAFSFIVPLLFALMPLAMYLGWVN
ncbi:succinate dehydrogenase cytochrome b subunit [Ferruginibacter albus]|uniref:succinate dehydrogenase cytochrome b subunit n=1 Tax=Ferruginibacter albus TaxID=2875540 RepID=UPI001CC4FA74|nr:succinate dehydrogenase cytochrome b subunit [Ferruginibacter albus]UAY53491.1 succinate dehydrogenase cytochrome b subunit [Ferruginibacter albus]